MGLIINPYLFGPTENAVAWNPSDKAANVVLSNGNLDANCNTAAFGAVRADTSRSSGLRCFELKIISYGGSSRAGVLSAGASLTTYLGNSASGIGAVGLYLDVSGFSKVGSDGGSTEATNDYLFFALNFSTGKGWFARNGIYRRGGDPAAGTLEDFTFSGAVYPAVSSYSPGNTYRLRTKASEFQTAMPSGFASWAAG